MTTTPLIPRDEAVRRRLLSSLSTMDERAQHNLLRLESLDELALLWDLAMRERVTDVAASIEVHANGRGQY